MCHRPLHSRLRLFLAVIQISILRHDQCRIHQQLPMSQLLQRAPPIVLRSIFHTMVQNILMNVIVQQQHQIHRQQDVQCRVPVMHL